MAAECKDDRIEYLRSVDTPTLSNAIELLHLRPRSQGFTPLQIRCLFPEFGRMCGYAVTAQVETMTESDGIDRGPFMRLYEAVAQSPRPAVVAFQEIGPHPDYAAHCGEVMATVFTHLGAVGLVTDCGVRDMPEVRTMRFQYFARGTVASHAYFRVARVGVPIQLMGLEIEPQDLLHGDENGLILVPKEALEDLPKAVDAVRKREGSLMEFVRGPDFSLARLKSRMSE